MNNKFIYSMVVFIFLYSFLILRSLLEKPTTDGKSYEISSIINSAAQVYLRKQFFIIWILTFIIGGIIYFTIKPITTLAFFIGVSISTLICFFNMKLSLMSNSRVLAAIEDQGLSGGFRVAMLAGSAASVFLPGLCLLVITTAILFVKDLQLFFLGISLGVSLVSIFARLGGGIFTKGADIGADLVGKVEQGLPEDDIRNPAVIADNVGDNVGDCSGTSADLVESYIIAITSAIILYLSHGKSAMKYIMKPIIVCLIGVFSCSIPLFFMKFQSVWKEIHRYFVTSILTFVMIISIFVYNNILLKTESICILLGAFSIGFLLKITEYYTSSEFSPVQSIANASNSGAGTNIIYGLALSYESTMLPVLTIFSSLMICYVYAGIYGIAHGAVGAIALTPAIMTLDIFGPISDNAGGIAEMSHMHSDTLDATEVLDEVGNTTKAITKGFAICASVFASVIMIYSFDFKLLNTKYIIKNVTTSNISVICGLFIGSIIPNFFASMSLKSVGNAAMEVVLDIREQIKESPKILTGEVVPDYNRTITILTNISIKEMIIPTLVPILLVMGAFFIYKYFVNLKEALTLLCFLAVGATVSCTLTGISMCIAGGAWDNAKKYIESGQHGGKNSDAHKAAVIGDTVGDPYKDTVGPALNSLCKLINLITIIIISSLVNKW